MASPKFDSKFIFDSWKTDSSTHFSEGVLWEPSYNKVRQKLHFNGENGDRYLTHGWADRPWVYKGMLSASNIIDLWSIFANIENYIDEADTDNSTYHPLVDSFGNPFPAAQIHDMQIADIHISQDGAFFAHVQISGIINGMVSDGSEDSGA